jgi:branched-chain amino acid aminotransferase
VDRITVGKGTLGPITRTLQNDFFALLEGKAEDKYHWLTKVPVRTAQPAGA